MKRFTIRFIIVFFLSFILAGFISDQTKLGKITEVRGDAVTINLGSADAIKIGMEGRIFFYVTVGEEQKEIWIAKIIIESIEQNSSKAKISEGIGNVRVGYYVSFNSSPPPKDAKEKSDEELQKIKAEWEKLEAERKKIEEEKRKLQEEKTAFERQKKQEQTGSQNEQAPQLIRWGLIKNRASVFYANFKEWFQDGNIFKYENGKYSIDTTNSMTFAKIIWYQKGKIFSNFELSVKAHKVLGPDIQAFGIIFGAQDDDNYSYFSIGGNGEISVGKWIYGRSRIVYIKDINQEAINPNSVNSLKVISIGYKFWFFVNGMQVATTAEMLYKKGYIGLIVGQGLYIRYEDLKIVVED